MVRWNLHKCDVNVIERRFDVLVYLDHYEQESAKLRIIRHLEFGKGWAR